MRLTDVVGRFAGAKQSGDVWALKCPAHDDRVASVSMSEGDDGRVLVHCHAGCSTADILASVGLTVADLFAAPRAAMPAPAPVLRSGAVQTYDYRDLDGVLLHQVVRGAGKSFRQRQPDGEG